MSGVIERFFKAFQDRDHAIMGACYHPDARFSDPVFPSLNAEQTRAMWRMLLTRGTDLSIRYRLLRTSDSEGEAEWQAWYTFGPEARKVHNIIRSRFVLRDGLIIDHQDSFSFWRWSRQALGPIGILLGWTPLLRSKVRGKAATSLRKAMGSGSATTS
jgi:hypothetical protein